jgi:tetratricopeptide (TPR) repeat protein
MEELGDEVFDEIEILCDKGEAYVERGKYRPAIKKYWKAFDLVPEPKTQYPAGVWLLTAIGDVNFIVRNYAEGVKNLTKAKGFPDGDGNPFIHFRLGQCQLELGNIDEALEELSKAFNLEGASIFDDEDPKYLAFFKEER